MPTPEEPSQRRFPNPKLVTVAEKHLVTKCRPSTLTYCPSMDLIALATEDDQVHIFRLNGQEASGGPFGKQGIEVRGARWNMNGNVLAIAGSDNTVRLVSAYSGKTVHELSCAPAPQPQGRLEGEGNTSSSASISCIGWGAHLTNARASLEDVIHERRDLSSGGGGVGGSGAKASLEEILSATSPSSAGSVQRLHRIAADLPRELAVLDVERSLPKLSVLPSAGDDDDVFSSRASLDSMFEAAGTGSADGVDVLLAGFDDGSVHLRIFGCFEIGSLNVRSSVAGSSENTSCRVIRHSWSPPSSTHSLLFSVSHPESGRQQLRLLTLDLLFINKSGQYLSLLASKVTQLQNLLRYVNQTQKQISLEWKSAQELPSRFIANVDEDLEEKYQCDFVTAAYHLIVTGNCFEPVKEFFVDQLGDRGHKRWEKAVGSGYENIQRLTHECLLPALERCGVLLSRLVGLSKYHRISPVLGLETKDLKECLESVDCLNLLSHKILNHASREYREFGAFSRWLRHEIDLQAAEPLSAAEDELMASSDTIDYPLTLTYVRGAMTRSALKDFIKTPTTPAAAAASVTEQGSATTGGQAVNGSFYESYKRLLRQVEEQKQGQQKREEGLPKLGDLVSRLQSQCGEVFGRVAETQRRGILHRSPLALPPDCDENVMDMLMGFMRCDGQVLDTVRIVSKSREQPYRFYIYSVILTSVNGVSSTKDVRVTCISLRAGDIKSVKFVDEENRLLMLWSDLSFSTHLVSLPLNSIPHCTSEQEIQLRPADAARGVDIPWDQRPSTVVQIDLLDRAAHGDKGWIWHTFDDEGLDEEGPVSLEVNPLKGRRAICVLYADGMRYEVLDMDNAVQGDEDEREEL